MNQRTRRSRISELLNQRGECSVEHLARRVGVSTMTIRRDLQALAAAGRVIRTHGGATPAERIAFEFQFLERSRKNRRAKWAIAAAAAELVDDGQSVLLDSGTTTLALAERLKTKKSLTVITTSLPIASALQFCERIEVLLLGGFVRRDSPDLTGALTEANVERLRADVAFIGADGVDRRGNIYNASLPVGRLLGKMASSANRVYVVADSSKIGASALMRFGSIAKWDGLITDAGVERATAAALRRAGVNLIKASNIERRRS